MINQLYFFSNFIYKKIFVTNENIKIIYQQYFLKESIFHFY